MLLSLGGRLFLIVSQHCWLTMAITSLLSMWLLSSASRPHLYHPDPMHQCQLFRFSPHSPTSPPPTYTTCFSISRNQLFLLLLFLSQISQSDQARNCLRGGLCTENSVLDMMNHPQRKSLEGISLLPVILSTISISPVTHLQKCY